MNHPTLLKMQLLRLLPIMPACCLAVLWCGFSASLPGQTPKPIAPDTAGTVSLHASNAVVHGTMLRYEPQTNKNCLGYWTKAEDWAEWTFTVSQPGEFDIEVWQGCGKGQGGSDVIVELGGKKFPFTVLETGHFQNFVPRRVGRIKLPAGQHSLAVKPQTKKAGAVMDIREVRLLPVTASPSPP